jgi:DNA polymerase-3 subunit alpha
MRQRFANAPNSLELVIKSVEFMNDVKDKRIERFTIYIDSTLLHNSRMNDLEVLLKSNPGNVPLYFNIHDSEHNTDLTLLSHNTTIDPSKKLLNFLDDLNNETEEHETVRYAIN